MNAEQLIMEEAERRYPLIDPNIDLFNQNGLMESCRKDFIEAATFGASLNGWVSVKDRLPTEQDADEFMRIEVWFTIARIPHVIMWYKVAMHLNDYSHWRKIVKP